LGNRTKPLHIAPRNSERNAAAPAKVRPIRPTKQGPRCEVRRTGTVPNARTDGALHAALERTERRAVEKVLAQTNGNVAQAAARLGILRTSLYRIMKRCGIANPSSARD